MKAMVVDDDLALADIIAFILQRAGFQIILAHDGKTAITRWQVDAPDLIILDLNLPNLNGFEVCRHIREQSSTPIIVVSVRGEEDDIIKGLKLGADDYIVKPFSPRQMLARVEAVLRRAGSMQAKSCENIGSQISAAGMVLDVNRQEIQRTDGAQCQLTYLESRLMDILMRNCGQTVPAEMLIDYIWGPLEGDRVMLKQLVYRLRRKIEPDPSHPIYLETQANLGYSLSPR